MICVCVCDGCMCEGYEEWEGVASEGGASGDGLNVVQMLENVTCICIGVCSVLRTGLYWTTVFQSQLVSLRWE